MGDFVDRFIRWVRDHRPSIPIGPGPTYWRWFVIPRNPIFNVYLHHFLNDDEEYLHDHRYFNISIVLQGSYYEERFEWKPICGEMLPRIKRRQVKRFIVRAPWTPHRIVLCRDFRYDPMPMWSLFIAFPHMQNWGFFMPDQNGMCRWTPHQDVVSDPDPLSLGYGRNRRL